MSLTQQQLEAEVEEVLARIAESDEIQPPENAALIGGSRDDFVRQGCETLRALVRDCGLSPSERVLEIGCGLGRIAQPLARYLKTGAYVGTDVDPDSIRYCSENITSAYPNFTFSHIDAYNEFYNPEARRKLTEIDFPFQDASFDLAFFSSVFTHLDDSDLRYYASNLSKCLRPGGRVWATYFLIDAFAEKQIAAGAVSFWPCLFDLSLPGPDYYSDSKKSTIAVGYRPEYIEALYAECGLEIDDVFYGTWSGAERIGGFQDLIVAHVA